MNRKGFTLVECIVVVAIIATLISLLLPAIQRVRLVQMQLECKLNLRSISQAMLSFAADKQGSLPGILKPPEWNSADRLPLFEYVKYVSSYSLSWNDLSMVSPLHPLPEIKAYRSPNDSSIADFGYVPSYQGLSSYAVNMLVHQGKPRLSTNISDGLSNTIYAAEHLTVSWFPGKGSVNCYGAVQAIPVVPTTAYPNPRIAAFANAGSYDVVPVQQVSPLLSVPSVPGVTFQHLPTVMQADPGMLHSTFPQGLLVSMCDGSTRCISPKISVNVFWSLITPTGGENVKLDDE